MYKKIIFLLMSSLSLGLSAQTISEKKAAVVSGTNSDMSREMQTFLIDLNREVGELQDALQILYFRVQDLYQQGAPECAYKDLLDQINQLKAQRTAIENTWRSMATEANMQEGYALWHQPETTLGQLVVDFGSQDFVYLMTPDIASIKISINSNLPIPRASWNNMLEMILIQNGIGTKQLNPYLRQLYSLRQDRSAVQLITNKKLDLDLIASEAKAVFILTPQPAEAKGAWVFLEKFMNPNSTSLQAIGRDIFIIGPAGEIKELLKLYDYVVMNKSDKAYRILPVRKVNSDEMAKILSLIFDQLSEEPKTAERVAPPMNPMRGPNPAGGPPGPMPRPAIRGGESSNEASAVGLRVIPLSEIAQAIFLVGTPEEIRKAEEIVRDVENQVGEAREKVIYWYTTKHSEPEELARVLEKVYALMVQSGALIDPNNATPPGPELPRDLINVEPPPIIPQSVPQTGYLGQPIPLRNIFDPGYFLDDRYIVDPRPRDEFRNRDPNLNRNNFIVDPKSSAIVMVVEASILPKMKDLIKKLDIPKKMVQIEVLLFEKRINNVNNYGLNLLRIGSNAENKNRGGFDFLTTTLDRLGITQFFLSRKKSHSTPAFDIVYTFLLTQDDVQINSAPSVLTLNQTPAKIDITEEISIDTGLYEIPATGDIALKRAFARARYGIKIEITPTIHMAEDDMEFDTENYVTLLTNISFETIQVDGTNRPPVTNRTIANEVRIPDGQTVIIGGLRRKNTRDRKESVPFLGELPGIGKLFSSTQMDDQATDMFVFITPKIVVDPSEDLDRLRCEEMARRPGDLPYFLCELVAAREAEKNRLMAGTMTILFGRAPERCVDREGPIGEYKGPIGEYNGCE